MSDSIVPPELSNCFHPIRMPQAFVPTWAGPVFRRSSPDKPEWITVGSELGQYLLMQTDGMLLINPSNGSPSHEAVNGIVITDTYLTISTREEISCRQLSNSPTTDTFVIPHGAHGLGFAPTGHIIAPLGDHGILIAKPPFQDNQTLTAFSAPDEELYAYKARTFSFNPEALTLVVAARYSGIAFAPFSTTAPPTSMARMFLDNVDMIDFAPIRTPSTPNGFVALGKDGSMTLFRDLLADREPTSLTYRSIEGSAYRVFVTGTDLFVFTSRGIYVVADFNARFEESKPGSVIKTDVLAIPLGIVNVELCTEGSMIIITEDETYFFDLIAMREEIKNRKMHNEDIPSILAFKPSWHDFAPKRNPMSLIA